MKHTINHAIYKTNGKHDECYTPRYAVEAILPYIPSNMTIWCPFDTEESFFVKVLRENGYNVIHSHIDNGQDFFEYEPEHWDIIVSNPPFTNKKQIFDRAFSFGKPFILLMTAQWLNDSAPVQLYQKHQKDMQIIHFTKRINFIGGQGVIPFKSIYFCCDILPKGNVLLDI
jgi:hypothetical protein